ncbi:hypothetical protein CVT26_007492 [Gymnopilus dilepis]|uniref:Uncharacterized protein n=1 Tax=Gymnopilus dilepis TaxID=231916 RepID=A0A409X170_9AGAR|nr:hypothetical protein CVT26_007492 [Gymnopilus dilepis]
MVPSSLGQGISNLHAGQRSHFDKLPIELVKTIFETYASYCDACPLTLGAVCKEWRRVAWSTPGVWTFLRMEIGLYEPRSWPLLYELLAEWLRRCQKLPLNIRFYAYSEDPRNPTKEDSEVHNGARLVELLNQYSGQWRSVDILLPERLMALLGSSASCVNSKLYSLSLAMPIKDSDQTPCVKPALGGFTPRIVSIIGFHLNPDSLTWTNVTDLLIAFPNVEDVHHIFQSAERLQKCVFLSVCFNSYNSLRKLCKNPVNHLQLKILEIGFASQEVETFFMDVFTFPNLTSFIPTGALEELRTLGAEHLIKFLERHSKTLREMMLCLDDYTFEDAIAILHLLGSFEKLEELRIAGGSNKSIVMSSLCELLEGHLPSDDRADPILSEPLFPSLRVFSRTGYDSFPWRMLVSLLFPLSLLENRRRPLRMIRVDCICHWGEALKYIPQDVLSILSEFCDEIEFKIIKTMYNQGAHVEKRIDWWQASVNNLLV